MSTFDNNIFKLAFKFVNETNKSVFLTGKAGTGKTTFLNTIKQNTFKKTAIVAPTGIAAINANGTTIHSFFNLPLGPFIPNKRQIRTSLDSAKKKVLNELELLIIDEVSMLRADTLDAIDYMLRTTRKKNDLPFGGVQILYVGDLYQLSPIIADDEWQQIKEYYNGVNFLNAMAIKKEPPVFLELSKVYRQTDDTFIEILNQVRIGKCLQKEIDIINGRFDPNFLNENSYVVLTTHNAKADFINEKELKNLKSLEHSLWADVEGDFDEASFPAENCLRLKTGARVMLLRNDKGKDKKYYNGKTGIVQDIGTEKISILLEDGAITEIEKEVWSKIKYGFNELSNSISPVTIGTFRQFPIRLAWAITIHKSQGLTFENAVVDLEGVFTPGQVYVALSRVKSLNGLILHSLINEQIINKSVSVSDDSYISLSEDNLNDLLITAQGLFAEKTLKEYFSWLELSNMVSQNSNLINNNSAMLTVVENLKKCHTTSLKFQEEIGSICNSKKEDKYLQLQQRIGLAASYYIGEIDKRIMPVVKDEYSKTKHSVNLKLLFRFYNELKNGLDKKRNELIAAESFIEHFVSQVSDNVDIYLNSQNKSANLHASSEVKAKVITPVFSIKTNVLQMFKSGKSIAEISKEKSLNVSAIENQLAGFISTGEISVHELIPENVFQELIILIKSNSSLSSIKSQLGDKVTYGQINAAKIYHSIIQRD
ncbi:AAA family ATPase [Ferruginibacter paludis]|uniref:helix-turn-helix domain-containing protein n=1 Tax=Ferruginibacter paludis TaxID=1310417 RepID=UPI0025B3CDCE|nr:helix-turn-helix domain-containing protein [Ferruginibacter paludis]MDN3657846.1 AAA family ATPase [Ferruginibacter paludis]